MNENNLKALKNQVMYTGFGETLAFQIQDNVEKNKPEFQIKYSHEFGRDKVDAILNFKQSEQGNYFFNSYDLSVSKDGQLSPIQNFRVNRPEKVVHKLEGAEDKIEYVNSTITLKEAYNMMEGRSVLKDFVNQQSEKYAKWLILDFKNTDDKGNFTIRKLPEYDLESQLAVMPIKELLNSESKEQLIESLQKGNRQTITILKGDTELRWSVEANALFKAVKFYDGNAQQQVVRQKESSGQSEKQDTEKQNQKQDKGEDAPRNTTKRSARQSNGKSTRKRNSIKQ